MNDCVAFQIESTSPFAAIEVERVFSAHNLVKTNLRTGLTIESSAAQMRLLMMKHRLDFGSESALCLEALWLCSNAQAEVFFADNRV